MHRGSMYLLLTAVVALIFGVNSAAHAYIDPGTASAVWAAGLAPIIAFLGLAGRWVVRLVLRKSGDDEEDQENSDADTD